MDQLRSWILSLLPVPAILKTLNSVINIFIKTIDLRQPNSAITPIQPPCRYTPNFDTIKIWGEGFSWKNFKEIPLDAIFYKNLEKAYVLGSGIVTTQHREVILESTIFQREYFDKLSQQHLVLKSFFKKGKTLQRITISLSTLLEDNYYHWILESVTRVAILSESFNLSTLSFILNKKSLRFKKESLTFLFNVSEQNIIAKKIDECYTGRVIVPSFPHTRNNFTGMTDVCHPFAIKKVNQLANQKLTAQASHNYSKKIVLSRKKSPDRRIVNEEAFISQLGDSDYVLIQLEELSFPEQVELFYHASIVIATHGAGLTNILFSKSITVIELFPEERNKRDAFCFTQISSVLGFTHHILPYHQANEQGDVYINDELLHKIKSVL